MVCKYVEEKRKGFYYVAGTRVPLASVVYAFREGESPEGIRQSFPTLNLEQVYGAITFCLANTAVIDAYLRRLDLQFEKGQRTSTALPEDLQRRLRAATHMMKSRASNGIKSYIRAETGTQKAGG